MRKLRWIFGLLIALGLAMRLMRLEEPLWLDEVLALHVASGSAGSILERLSRSPCVDPPLFFFALHGWRRLVGHSDQALHLLTALLGILGIGALWRASRRMGGALSGLAAAALLALHPLHLAHSQELRPYGLLVLCATLSTHAFYKAITVFSRRHCMAYALTTLLGLYSHHYALFLFFSQIAWLSLLIMRRGWSPERRKLLWVMGGVCVAYLPYLPMLYQQWRNPSFSYLPRVGFEQTAAAVVTLGGVCVKIGESSSRWPVGLMAPLLVLILGLYAFGCSAIEPARREILSMLLFLSLVTLLVPFGISAIKPMFNPFRHSIIVLPLICLIGGLLINEKRPLWSGVALAMCCMLFLWTDARYFSQRKSYAKEIAGVLRSWAQPDLAVLATEHQGTPIARYFPEGRYINRGSTLSQSRPPRLAVVVRMFGTKLSAAASEALARHYEAVDQRSIGGYSLTYFRAANLDKMKKAD